MQQFQKVSCSGPQVVRYHTRDGLTLLGDARGAEDSMPVLLLHGGGQTRHSWAETAVVLARNDYYPVTVDLRGHGDSDWASDGNYSLEAFADDIHTIAASFKRPPLLVGASLGGIISLILAGEKATPMRALVLVDVAPEVEESGVKRIIAFMQRYHEGFETLAAAAEAIHNYLPHRSRPRSLNGLKKNLRQGAHGRYYWRWDPRFLTNFEHDISWKGERLSAAARRLHIPVLLVRGVLSDVVSPATAKEFLKLVPHAQHVDLAAAGHMIAGDTNDAFTQVILEFFNRLIITEKKR